MLYLSLSAIVETCARAEWFIRKFVRKGILNPVRRGANSLPTVNAAYQYEKKSTKTRDSREKKKKKPDYFSERNVTSVLNKLKIMLKKLGSTGVGFFGMNRFKFQNYLVGSRCCYNRSWPGRSLTCNPIFLKYVVNYSCCLSSHRFSQFWIWKLLNLWARRHLQGIRVLMMILKSGAVWATLSSWRKEAPCRIFIRHLNVHLISSLMG